MQAMTFDMLKDAWDRMKALKAAEFKAMVPGLVGLPKITLKRVSEDEQHVTIEFGNLQQAMQDPMTDVPAFNKAVMSWLKRVSPQAQIVPGSQEALIVRIQKEIRQAAPVKNLNTASSPQPKYESKQTRPLIHITSVRTLEK
jgi:hypothetical protein